MVTWHAQLCIAACEILFFFSHLDVPWQKSCDVIHLHHAVLLSGLGNMSARWRREGGEGERSAGVACRPSVGLWCKRACERLPCDTPTALRQELRHRQLTVALELNAATHAVIGLVFETRPSSRRTTSFFLAFSGEEPVGFMQLLAPKLFRNKTPTLVSYPVYSLVC